MAPETATAETNTAQLSKRIDLDGTLSDLDKNVSSRLKEITLPQADKLKAFAGEKRAAEVRTTITSIEARLKNFKENSNLLTQASFGRWSNQITSSNERLAKALKEGKPEEFLQILKELNRDLGELVKFFEVEKAQGLVATHAETGIRIYADKSSVWLCTPDKNAFGYEVAGRLEKLSAKVKDGSGLVYVPEGGNLELRETVFQKEGMQGDSKLLGCRVDNLALTGNDSTMFKVVTHLLKEGDVLDRQVVQFTLAEALNGDLAKKNGFANKGEAPELSESARALAVPPEGSGADSSGSQSELDAEGEDAAPARNAIKAGARIKPPSEAAKARARAKLKGPADVASETIENYKQKFNPEIDTPAKLASAVDDLDSGSKAFAKAIDDRVAYLNEEIKHVGEAEASALRTEIDELSELKRQGVRTHRDLLLKQIDEGDDAVKAGAQRKLLGLADEVNEIYDYDIDKATPGADTDDLVAKKNEFNEKVAQCRKDVGTWRQKLKPWIDKLRIKIPGPFTLWGKIARRWNAKQAEAGVARINGLADDLPTDAKVLGKELRTLDSDCKAIDKRIGVLEEEFKKAPTQITQTELDKLNDAKTKATLRRKAGLEKQLADAGDNTKLANKIKGKLYSPEMAADVDAAYERIARGGPPRPDDATALDDYRTQQEEYQAQQAQQKVTGPRRIPGTKWFTDKVVIADKALQRAQAAYDAAPDGSTPVETSTKAKLEADLELAKLDKAVAEAEAEASHYRRQVDLDPENSDLANKLDECETKLAEQRTKQAFQGREAKRAEARSLAAEIDEIDTKIAASPPDDELAELNKQKADLKAKKAALGAEIEEAAGLESQASAQQDLADAKKALKDAESELKANTDADAKDALEQKVKDAKSDVHAKSRAAIAEEIDAAAKAKYLLEQEAYRLKTELDDLDAGSDQAKQLQKQLQDIENKMNGLDQVQKGLQEQAEIAKLKEALQDADTRLPDLETEYADLDGRSDLDDAGQTRKAECKAEIDEIKASQTRLAELEKGWAKRIAGAKAAGAKLLRNLKNMNWKFSDPNSAWHKPIEGPGRFMEKNPMKAALIAASLAEAYRGLMTADVSDDAVHTCVPSLVYLLEKPLENWGVELEAMEFTTKESGALGARLAEAGAGVGNVGIVMSGIKLGQVGLSRFAAGRVVLKGLGYAAAPLTFVAVGGFAFYEYSDYRNWENDTGLQDFGKTSFNVGGGALAGSFFGPVGAGAGAFIGGICEGAGVTYSLYKLDKESDANWEKRGVRDSIQMASDGFILPKNDPRVRSRGGLSANEKEMITDLAKDLTLRKIFGIAFDQTEYESAEDSPDTFSESELRRAGFIVPDRGASKSKVEEAQVHNWNRLNELYDNVENNYNPFTSWGHLDELKSKSSIGARFQTIANESFEYYEDLYNRSMRIKVEDHRTSSAVWEAAREIWYQHPASPAAWLSSPQSRDLGGVKRSNEALDYMKEVAKEFRRKFDKKEAAAKTPEARAALAEEQWKFFYDMSTEDVDKRRFPQLETLLADTDIRNMFLAYFKSQSSVGGKQKPLTEFAMWTDMKNCKTGTYMLNKVMPGKLINDSIDEALALAEAKTRPATAGD